MTGIAYLLCVWASLCRSDFLIDCFWDVDRAYSHIGYSNIYASLRKQQKEGFRKIKRNGMGFVLGSMRVHREDVWSPRDEGSSRVLAVANVIISGLYQVFCVQEISFAQALAVARELKDRGFEFSFRHSDDYGRAGRKYKKLCVFFNASLFSVETNSYCTLSRTHSYNVVMKHRQRLYSELYIDSPQVSDSLVQVVGLRNKRRSDHFFYIANTCLPYQDDWMASFHEECDPLSTRTMANCENLRLLDVKNAIYYMRLRAKKDTIRFLDQFEPVIHYFVVGGLGVRRRIVDRSYLSEVLARGKITLFACEKSDFPITMRDENTLVVSNLPRFKRAACKRSGSGFTFVRTLSGTAFCDMCDFIYYASTSFGLKHACSSVCQPHPDCNHDELPRDISLWIGSVFKILA